MTIGWCFDNTYSKLPDPFKEKIGPVPVKNPELVILNKNLSKELNLDFSNLDNKKISELKACVLKRPRHENIIKEFI